MSEFYDQPLIETGVHLWGSHFAVNRQQALEEIASIAGPYLVFGMADPELDISADSMHGVTQRELKDWVVGKMKYLETVPGIQVMEQGHYENYEDMSRLEIGAQGLDPDTIDFGYYTDAKQLFPGVKAVLQAHSLGHVPFQVGIPGYRQIPTFAFGYPHREVSKFFPALGELLGQMRGQRLKYAKAITESIRRDIVRLVHDTELLTHGLGIQREYPVETIITLEAAKKSKRLGGIVAKIMGARVAKEAEDLPPDMASAIHNCLGRFRGLPAVRYDPEEPGAVAPLANLINEQLAHWPKDHVKPRVVGAPVIAEGGRPLSKKAMREVAAQLADIELPPETILAPGIVTYNTPTEYVVRFADIIQNKIGRPIAISPPCGTSSLRPGNQLHDPQAPEYPADAARIVLTRTVRAAEMLRTA